MEQMIRTHFASSGVEAIIKSLVNSFQSCSGLNAATFDVLIDTYKVMGMLDEAADSGLV